MPYIKKCIIAGDVMEVRKTYSARYGLKGIKREKNHTHTKEAQREINERAAIDKLTWKLNANFGVGDMHLVLGYGEEQAPTPEEGRRELDRFMRKARTFYRREAGKELRYITVTEYENARIHHHIIMPGIPLSALYDLWPHGRPHITPLDDRRQYRRLAEYFVKETAKTFRDEGAPYKKRWNQSRNLKEPVVTVEIISAKQWTHNPKPKSGYYLDADSLREGIDSFTGYPYQYYTMIRVKAPGGRIKGPPQGYGYMAGISSAEKNRRKSGHNVEK